MMTLRASTLILLAAGLLVWTPSPAQVVNEKKDNQVKINVDLAVPESPAFAVLDITPQTVTRPTSTEEFATSLLNGVDKNGNFQAGVAVDTIPYLLFFGHQTTLEQYVANPNGFNVIRQLSRLQFSAATAKGANDDDKSLRLALGFRATPWDAGDPRFDQTLIKCMKEDTPPFPRIFPGDDDAVKQKQRDEYRKELKKAAESCREGAEARLWNRSSWSLGVAPSWISTDGTIDRVAANGTAFWTSLAWGFEGVPGLKDSAQVILYTRYRLDEHVVDPKVNGRFIKQDRVALGGRIRFGGKILNGSVEGLWLLTQQPGRSDDSSVRVSVGAEYQITRGVWLELSVGGEGGRRDGNNQAFALGSFKWGTSRDTQLVPGRQQ